MSREATSADPLAGLLQPLHLATLLLLHVTSWAVFKLPQPGEGPCRGMPRAVLLQLPVKLCCCSCP